MAQHRYREDQLVDHLLGDLEAPIMRLMWQRETATVRNILEALDTSGRSLAYTTVMTVMARLAEKGMLVRERIGRSHIYRASTSRDQFLRQSASQRVQGLVQEFGDLAVARFLAEVSELSPERRRQLERLAHDGSQ
jgi:predicted transcriptional regulator